jgi:hypothetical protein
MPQWGFLGKWENSSWTCIKETGFCVREMVGEELYIAKNKNPTWSTDAYGKVVDPYRGLQEYEQDFDLLVEREWRSFTHSDVNTGRDSGRIMYKLEADNAACRDCIGTWRAAEDEGNNDDGASSQWTLDAYTGWQRGAYNYMKSHRNNNYQDHSEPDFVAKSTIDFEVFETFGVNVDMLPDNAVYGRWTQPQWRCVERTGFCDRNYKVREFDKVQRTGDLASDYDKNGSFVPYDSATSYSALAQPYTMTAKYASGFNSNAEVFAARWRETNEDGGRVFRMSDS